MANRKLQITHYIGPAPHVGICTKCGELFKVTTGVTFTVQDATQTLQSAFDKHECKGEDFSQAAARIVREATEKN